MRRIAPYPEATEQAAQIQKVSAQVQMSKRAAKVVVNKP
jgi:hypothetical protein